jgi:hypothetical protein
MRRYTFIYGLILALILAGCAKAPQPGAPVTQATACTEENNGKRVSIEGYPRVSGLVYVSDDFSVDLFEQPGGEGKSVSAYLKVGTGANHAENLPDNFSDEDLHIHTNDNQVVSTDSRIRVHGELSWIKSPDGSVTCFISPVDLIEAAPVSQ